MQTKFLNIKKIVFTDGSSLENRSCALVDNFLVIESDEPDTAPSWFNTAEIAILKEVTNSTDQRRQMRIL